MPDPRIICLCGFMGAGKSSVGKQLAYMLDNEFIDLDSYIEKKEGRSIAEIFESKGEEGFRTIETNSLKEIFHQRSTHLVLSIGGGTICYPLNAEIIKKNCHRVYLRATVDTLAAHLSKNADSRPLLRGKDIRTAITDLMAKRASVYEAESDYIVDIDGKNIKTIAENIEDLFY